jgi:hypothetical protein
VAKIELRIARSSSDAKTRASLEKVAARPLRINDRVTQAIQYLRHASGRTTIALSAFYLYFATVVAATRSPEVSHTEIVKRETIKWASTWAIALCIRSIFDRNAKGELTAKVLLGLNRGESDKVVRYWSEQNGAVAADARFALAFVARMLDRCSVPIRRGVFEECVLVRRVALLEAYANRAAAHISLEGYAFSVLDVAHVVAATAMWGAVIHGFDNPDSSGAEYLIGIDRSAHAAALEVFPDFAGSPRLLNDEFIRDTLPKLVAGQLNDEVDYLSCWLLSAVGWDEMPTTASKNE